MPYVLRSILFFALFLDPSAWAQEASIDGVSEGTVTAPACKTCFNASNPVSSLLVAQCKAENYLLGCDRQLLNHPNRTNLISDCSESDVYQDALLATPDHLSGCLTGLGIMKDQIKEVLKKVYAALIDANNQRNLFLAELEFSVANKRAYVEGENVAYLKKLSDQELDAMSAELLQLEVIKFKNQVSSSELSAGNKVIPYSRASLELDHKNGDTPYQALTRFGSYFAKAAHLQPLCLKPKPKAAYLCYVVAYSVSFMPLGGGSGTRAAALNLLKKEAPEIAEEIVKKGKTYVAMTASEGVAANSTLGLSRAAPRYTTYQREKLIDQLVTNFKDRRVVSPSANKNFAEVVDRRKNGNRSAVLVTENPILKKLNTVSQRPEIADAINNKHKDLLFKNEELLKDKYKISTQKYSAYKEGNLAISDADYATIEKFNSDLHTKTFKEFSEDPEILAVSEKYDVAAADLIRAGTGADYTEAKIYARLGRRQSDPLVVTGPGTPGATEALKRAIVSIDQLQVQLTTKRLPNGTWLRDTDVMTKIEVPTMGTSHTSSRWIPSQKTIELLRKSQGNEEKFAMQMKKVFGIELPKDTQKNLMAFAASTDQFITDALVTTPQSLNLPATNYGIVAIDLPGIGAANQFEIAKQLAGAHRQLDGAFNASKVAEQNVTKKLDQIRSEFKRISLNQTSIDGTALGADGVQVISSGDDIFVVFKREVTKEQQQSLISKLSQVQGYGPPRFATAESSSLGSASVSESLQQGLGMEKALRENLQGEIPWQRLEDITVHVEMVGPNSTKLNLQTRTGQAISREEEALIRAQFDSLKNQPK